MKKLFCTAVAIGSMTLTFSLAQAATTADVLFVVDVSGSMSGEHTWLGNMITDLDNGLTAQSVTNNQYGLVSFGARSPNPSGQTVPVGGADWGTASDFSTAAGTLTASGGFEDGYEAISYALSNYSFRSDAALNIVLVTDEDRDTFLGSADTYSSIFAELTQNNAMLNSVVNATFYDDYIGDTTLGVDSNRDGYKADGTGGFISSAYDDFSTYGYGSTIADYADLAWATGGAAWDLNQLRAGGLTATSFSNAFVDIKVGEIEDQEPHGVPEPGTMLLMGTCLTGLVAFRKKRANKA